MATQDWRKLENRVAEYFGGRRRKQYKYEVQGPDVDNPVADIEVKLRAVLPKWITQTLAKCERWNTAKMTVLIFYEKGAENPEAGIAVIPARDLRLLLEAYQSNSEPPSLKTTPSGSGMKAQRKSRWKSRRLRSRKFSS